MNELHESRSQGPKLKMKEAGRKTPKRDESVREALAGIDPSIHNGSICERLESFTDATLLKVITLAHQKLVSVSLETCNLDLWPSDAFQALIDHNLNAFNTASQSVWREGIVRNTQYALCGYHRALGELAYYHFVTSVFPDGVPFVGIPEDDEEDF